MWVQLLHKAASDLYGEDSYEVQKVTDAWYAVGVGDPFTCTVKTISDKTYSSGTSNKIEGCRIEISNSFVQNGATLKVNATEWVVLQPGFIANAGSYVLITINGPAPAPAPPQPSPYIFVPSYETSFESLNQQSNTLSNSDLNRKGFTISPNPNAGTFQLETNFPLSDIDHLKITNTVGAVVYESQHLTSNEIQLQNTAPGLYFVVMVLKEGTVLTQKVMVQR